MLDGMCAVERPDPPCGLYATAEELADRFHQPRPDRIVLTLGWDRHTARMPKEAGPSAGELILFVGLPCLGVLWWHELRALIGAAVGNPPGSELKYEHFQRAAQAGGSAGARSAYEKMRVLDGYWEPFVEQVVEPLVRRGLRPPMLHGFRATLEGAPVAELIRQDRESLKHPDIPVNVVWRRLGWTAPPDERNVAAWEMLDDIDTWEAHLLAGGVDPERTRNLRPVTWPEAVRLTR